MSKKSKRHHIPSLRLAKAFHFTSEDLAANRLGFVTREQEWCLPLISRPIVSPILKLLPTKRRNSVEHMCGDISVWRNFLTVKNYHTKFRLTETQYDLLTHEQGMTYHVYYVLVTYDEYRIVSMERADNGC